MKKIMVAVMMVAILATAGLVMAQGCEQGLWNGNGLWPPFRWRSFRGS